jgi:predicted HicB family RNase H-like nuclease
MATRNIARVDPPPRVTRLPRAAVFSQLNVRIPGELGRQVRGLSARTGRSLNSIVIDALQRYLDDEAPVRETG